MQSANRIALKEWASVCAAVAEGRQTILLRKGGIDEGPGGFRVQHPEFWLFPTRFHQNAAELRPDAAALLAHPAAAPPPAATIRLQRYAVVTSVTHVTDPSRLAAFRSRHVLSESAVIERFEYRTPGLFVIEFRAFQRTAPHEITDLPEFAGCHSWVDLGRDLPADDLAEIPPRD